jgi:hypothetical protein
MQRARFGRADLVKATTGIEPVLSPLRANPGLLRPYMVGSQWLDMSDI